LAFIKFVIDPKRMHPLDNAFARAGDLTAFEDLCCSDRTMSISSGRKAGWAGNSMPTTRTVTPPKIERRLAAIMVADVAGYSRLMGTDEVGTLNALKEHRRDRIDPTIARHNGRIFKATGDGLLVEFASVVDAVGCAVAIQRAMLAFNAGIHADRQIFLRIGINVGDIIIDGDDVFGDGVNVAARLEALSEPGGVCISRYANEQVRDKLSLGFADLGEQTVKNIARAVGVYGLTARDIAALPEDGLPKPEPPELRTPLAHTRRLSAGVLVAGAVAVALLFATGSWWTLHISTVPAVTSPPVAPMAPRPAAHSAQDRRQSIIVLPFENSSDDAHQDSLAAFITREVTDIIARNSDFPLVPAVTAAAYRGQTLDLRAIGRDHNVHYALTGHARRQAGRLTVAATLYDTADVRQVWSRQFDSPDGPDTQNAIIQGIYSGVWQTTVDEEAARANREHPDNLDKRDLMLVALASPLVPPSKANFLAKIALTERALALDPNYLLALQFEARWRAGLVLNGLSSDPEADRAIAAQAADRMLLIAPNDLSSLRTKAAVLRAQGKWDEAAAVSRRVIQLQPLESNRHSEYAFVLTVLGRHKEALEQYITARQLAAGGDTIFLTDANIALALLANDQLPEAIGQARLAISEFPPDTGRIAEYPWLALIAAESESGQDAQARADLQKFLATPRTWRTMAEIENWEYFAGNHNLLDGLRRAGMPAE
jgi:class 3 adenylate cyclase/tetratricopeptide (TPR) repeat protein